MANKTNQILVYEKIFVTPELKKKRRFYKAEFFVSVFLLCMLFSYYIYAEYDRNKSEEVSKEILTTVDDTIIAKKKNDIVVVYLDNSNIPQEEMEEEIHEQQEPPMQADEPALATPATPAATYRYNGEDYGIVGTINIPKINVNYPILAETTDALLKISPCKWWGSNPNQVGNFCVVGHNYRNSKFFSKVPTLEIGDIIELTDLTGKKVTYSIFNKYTVDPTDRECTSQHTNGKVELTLITCTNDSSARVIVKARAI